MVGLCLAYTVSADCTLFGKQFLDRRAWLCKGHAYANNRGLTNQLVSDCL